MRSAPTLVTLLTFLVPVACTGTAPPRDPGPPASPSAGLPPWHELDPDQRMDRMKQVVLPRMREAFQRHDAAEFAEFNCITCHGSQARQGRFAMPNAELPPLDPTDGFSVHREQHPDGTRFMMETVVPQMAESLGVPPFDPETRVGFGCFGCHTKAR